MNISYMADMLPGNLSTLSPAQCILLAEALWEHARVHPDAVPVTEAQRAELLQRVEALEKGELPPAEPWADVQAWLKRL